MSKTTTCFEGSDMFRVNKRNLVEFLGLVTSCFVFWFDFDFDIDFDWNSTFTKGELYIMLTVYYFNKGAQN